MIDALPLRDYQAETVDATYADLSAGYRRLANVLPTGGGKGHLIARYAIDVNAAGQQAVAITHRQEITDAIEEKFRAASTLPVGVLQGRRREVDRPLLVASILTACRPGALSLLKQSKPGLLIVDECHHAAANSYQTLFRELGVLDGTGPRLIGVTATLDRADGLALGDTFEKVSTVIPIKRLIDEGWLLRPRGVRVKIEGLDLSRVHSSRTSDSGLDDRAVSRAMSDALAPAAIARAVLEHGKGRHGVAFLPSVELSKEQARVFTEHGIRAIHVDADTPKQVRREIIRRARLGEYDMVCNVGLFTEGTDVPIWDLVVLGRPTSSSVLFQQMLGRGLRVHPGQLDCLVMDMVAATDRHRLNPLVNLEGIIEAEGLDDELKQFDEDEPEVEADDEPGAPAREQVELADGPLRSEMFDLFATSHVAWQRSPRGVWYLPTGAGRAVVLAPAAEVDRYDVRWSDTGDLVHEDPLDLTTAMAWGDKAAAEVATRPIERDASWRRGRLSRLDRMQAIYEGKALGGELTPRTTGELVDQQDARWAAGAIDTLSWVAQVSPEGYWTT